MFLDRTYLLVPAGESGYLDFDAELTELLSRRNRARGGAPSRGRPRHRWSVFR